MPRLDDALWRDIMGYLRAKHGPICRQWFEQLEPDKFDGGLLDIRTETAVQQAYLQSRCREQFKEAAQQSTGKLVTVRFVHGDEPGPEATPAERNGDSRAGATVLSDDLVLQPDYSFEQFIEGPNNELAFALAQAVADRPAKAYNPLFIHGGVGLGKTHLLQAICLRILDGNPAFNIVYVSCEKFTNQFLECVRGGDFAAFRHHYRDADMLVVDDIHFLSEKERSQEEFFHTFNELHQQSKQIVLSSDAPPGEIPGLTDRLVSRFNWGVIAQVNKPSYETRVAIVRAKAALQGLEVPDEVAAYLAKRFEHNVRELEGAICTVSAHADFLGQPMTAALARKAMGDPGVEPSGRVTLQRIIDVVTDFYNVKTAELQSRRRHKSITEPRQVCMFLARQKTNLSLEEIGGHFGGRDHTTVMHSVQKIEGKVEEEPSFRAQVEQMEQRVEAALV